jgi:hypothetical protein
MSKQNKPEKAAAAPEAPLRDKRHSRDCGYQRINAPKGDCDCGYFKWPQDAAPEVPQDISEAYDIKNVNFRNLLSMVMGRVSNQTGESYDSAILRTKSADEILRRFKLLEDVAQSVIDEATDGLDRSASRVAVAREALAEWEAEK